MFSCGFTVESNSLFFASSLRKTSTLSNWANSQIRIYIFFMPIGISTPTSGYKHKNKKTIAQRVAKKKNKLKTAI